MPVSGVSRVGGVSRGPWLCLLKCCPNELNEPSGCDRPRSQYCTHSSQHTRTHRFPYSKGLKPCSGHWFSLQAPWAVEVGSASCLNGWLGRAGGCGSGKGGACWEHSADSEMLMGRRLALFILLLKPLL